MKVKPHGAGYAHWVAPWLRVLAAGAGYAHWRGCWPLDGKLA
jgi:hypothetical protein